MHGAVDATGAQWRGNRHPTPQNQRQQQPQAQLNFFNQIDPIRLTTSVVSGAACGASVIYGANYLYQGIQTGNINLAALGTCLLGVGIGFLCRRYPLLAADR